MSRINQLLFVGMLVIANTARSETFQRSVDIDLLNSNHTFDSTLPLGEIDSLAISSIFQPDAQFQPVTMSAGDSLHLMVNFRCLDGNLQQIRFVDYLGTATQLINFGPSISSSSDGSFASHGFTQYQLVTGDLFITEVSSTPAVQPLYENTTANYYQYGTRGNHTDTEFGFSRIEFLLTIDSIVGPEQLTANGINIQFSAYEIQGQQGSLFVEIVPEPSSILLALGSGCLALVVCSRYHRLSFSRWYYHSESTVHRFIDS